MARNTSSDQLERVGGTRYSSDLSRRPLTLCDARQSFRGVQMTELAHARGKSGSQTLVDVKYAFGKDLAIGRWEDELVKALRALDVVKQPALALVDVVHDEPAQAVLVLDAVDGGEQRLLAHEIRQ